MNIIILLRTAIRTIKKHTIRSLLTIIGITIGIAAIIVTFSIGTGAEKKVRQQILAMGEGAIYIISGNIIERGRVRATIARPIRLREKDLYAITEQIDTAYVSRGHTSTQRVEYGPMAVFERIYGVDENMLNINKNTIKSGQFFTTYHFDHRANVVVLGNDIAKKLFGSTNPIGKTITINERPFTVIGILNYIEYFWGIQDPNTRSFIPFSTAKKYFRKAGELKDDLGFIALNIFPTAHPGKTLRKVRRILRFMHRIENNEPDDFTIFDQASISKSAEQASEVIKLFGLITACIALIVGGIGVMNIMLVSVRERTKEIGIRLAIGATQRHIQLQFLLESVALTSVGGVLGIGVGAIAQRIISNLATLTGGIELIPLLIAFFMTILTGIFFGYYPAYEASKLNPVDALRE